MINCYNAPWRTFIFKRPEHNDYLSPICLILLCQLQKKNLHTLRLNGHTQTHAQTHHKTRTFIQQRALIFHSFFIIFP